MLVEALIRLGQREFLVDQIETAKAALSRANIEASTWTSALMLDEVGGD